MADLVARADVEVNPMVALAIAKAGAPIFIGVWISWVTYGTIVILVPNYLFAFRTNPLRERLFIIFLFLLNTVDVALDLSRIIKIYVSHFGDAVYLVEFSRRVEDAVLSWSSVYIIFFCQVFLSLRTHQYLAATEGKLHACRWVATATNVALILAATVTGLIGQWKLNTFDNYLEVTSVSSKDRFEQLYPIMRLLHLILCFVWLLPASCVLSFELFQAKKWQLRHEEDAERRLKSWSTKLFVGLRNGSPALVVQLLTLILYIVEGKAWTMAAQTALPRLFTIFVVLWTCVARPRKGSTSSSHTASMVPDLSWSSSQDDQAAGGLPTPASCALSASFGRLHPAHLFSRQGRRDWRVSLAEVKLRKFRGRSGGGNRKATAEPKAYVVDLRDEEEGGGIAARRGTILFPDDDANGQDPTAIEVKYGGSQAKQTYDDAAEWRAGLAMQETQSCFVPSSEAQYVPTLLRHRGSLPTSALRSTTPEHDDALPTTPPPLRSTYTAPMSPASPMTRVTGTSDLTTPADESARSPAPRSALQLFGLDDASNESTANERSAE